VAQGIVVVGSANMDLAVRVDALPGPGETVLGRDLRRTPGGKGLNQAIAAARAGATVWFVGAVGDDPEGASLRRTIVGEGIDDRHLRRVAGPTGVALIAVSGDGENQIVVAPGANATVDADAVQRAQDQLRSAAVTLTQLEIAPSALPALCRAAGVVVLNPAPARRLTPEELAVRVCVPNAAELGTLTGGPAPTSIDEAVAAARRLEGPHSVVVTLGAAGAVVLDSGHASHVPAPTGATVVDTTAAGDTLCGYLAAALADGAGLAEATRWGVRAASVSVGRAGAAASIPRRHELDGP
jgi:ribokinase